MGLKTTDILLIAGLASIALLFFFIGRGSAEKPPTHVGDKAAMDIMRDSLTHRMDIIQRKADSTLKVNAELVGRTHQLAAEKSQWQAQAKASAGKADWYAFRYEQARKVNDTPAALVSCDSLATEFTTFRDLKEKEGAAADSIIYLNREVIANQGTIIEGQRSQILQQKAFMDVQAANYGKLFADYKKERRKDNWLNRWGKPVLAGIAGGLIVYQIKK